VATPLQPYYLHNHALINIENLGGSNEEEEEIEIPK
jgi:hypothetical protein